MTQIHWKLKPYLETKSVAPHKLALEAGISPSNMYTFIRGDGAKNVSRDTLAKLIGALRRITGEAVTPNDLFEVIEDQTEADPIFLEGDASSLGSIDPYDWGNIDPQTIGEAIRAANAG